MEPPMTEISETSNVVLGACSSPALLSISGKVNVSYPVMDFGVGEAVVFDDPIAMQMYSNLDTSLADDVEDNHTKKLKAKKAKKLKVKVEKSADGEFLARDPEFQRMVEEGGDNPLQGVDQWALNRLKKFMVHAGLDCKTELVDMSQEVAVATLCQFFEQVFIQKHDRLLPSLTPSYYLSLIRGRETPIRIHVQVKKTNGQLYPTETLMSLLRAFSQVFRKHQERRVMSSGIDEIPFNMKQSPMFRRVCVACCLSMARSKDGGANVPRKKSKIVSFQSEGIALAHECTSKETPRGLQRRCGYYCNFRFSIRGGSELRKTKRQYFSFGTDARGRYMVFDDGTSKANRPSMKKHQAEHFRYPSKTYEADIVDTFERYFSRLPDGMPEGMDALFLTPIDHPKHHAWYARGVVGEYTLNDLVNFVLVEAGEFNPDEVVAGGQNVSNKSGRTTMITRMSENGVPDEVGMVVSGHKSKGAYKRYDQSTDVKVRAAARCAAEPIRYEVALEEEKVRMVATIYGMPEEDILPSKKLKITESDSKRDVNMLEASTEQPSMERTESASNFVDDKKGKEIIGDSCKAKKIMKRMTLDAEDVAFVEKFDWANDLEEWAGERQVNINPVKAMFAKLTNCTINLTVNNLNLKN